MAAQVPPDAAPRQGFRIVGVLLDAASNQPVSGALVSITASPERESSQSVQTGAGGHFSFGSLPPGKYSLTASARGSRPQGLNQHGNYFTGVAVGPNLDSEHVVFRLQPDATIEGHVVDEENEPVRNATIQLFARDYESGRRRITLASTASTDDQGFYNLPHLGPGTYYVSVSARPWYAQYTPHPSQGKDAASSRDLAEESAKLDLAYPMTFYPDADDSSRATPITLHVGEHVTADVVMRAVPSAHLRIIGGTQGGFPRVMQKVFDGYLAPVMSSQAFANAPGKFELDGLAPGHYVLDVVSNQHTSRRVMSTRRMREVELNGDVEVQADDAVAMSTVSGLVSFEGVGSVRRDLYVLLRNRDSGESWNSPISDRGYFGTSDIELLPGTYDVSIVGAPGLQIANIVARGAKVTGLSLTVGSGTSVQLVCKAVVSGQVTGTVMLGDRPAAGTMVLLVPHDQAGTWGLFRSRPE